MEVNKTKKRLATGDVEAEGDANNALKKLKKGKEEEEEEAATVGVSGAGDPQQCHKGGGEGVLRHTQDEVSHLVAMILGVGVPVAVLGLGSNGGGFSPEVRALSLTAMIMVVVVNGFSGGIRWWW